MEKFSAYRDPGTGIQPFLTPVPPNIGALLTLLLPLRYLLGTIRTALVILLVALYLVLVSGFCTCLATLPVLYFPITHALTAILGRTALFVLGLFWIPEEYVSRKRRRGNDLEPAWKPRPGDIIVSNWVSWIELVWLAIRFNPVFVVPVREHGSPYTAPRPAATRPRGNVTKRGPEPSQKHFTQICGFREVSLLSMISNTGHYPSHAKTHDSLENLRKKADRPIVIFPECTTSNGRALLRFAKLFHQNTPVKGYQVFLMSVRYDTPDAFSPSVSHSIPSPFLNPLPHLFKISTALKPITLHIRLLVPSESPSSPLFLTSEVVSDAVEDQLSEASAVLIAQLGKMKRTSLGWEDKASFLDFYHTKST